MNNRNMPEQICFWTIALTWLFYGMGALYLVGPIIAWLLFSMIAVVAYCGEAVDPTWALSGAIPAVVWVWVGGMSLMLVTLWIGHVNWGLDTSQIIKSSFGWAKGWALIAIFILCGSVLQIRREPIIRGLSIVGLCTLCLLPILLIAPYIGLPFRIFVSPLEAAGGPGPEYFSVFLYTTDPETMTPRWQFYAPWSPFAGMIGVMASVIALEEKERFWRYLAFTAGVAMIFCSQSRMSMVSLVVCVAIPRILPFLLRSFAWMAISTILAALSIFGSSLINLISQSIIGFRGARANSTRVRDTIQSIGYQRWQTEAFWFGHGTIARGTHIVEFMPIGSHHTWYGLLFVKGLVGLVALLIPLVCHFLVVFLDAIRSPRGRLPFAILLNFAILTFGENLEIEVYLFWPALILLGIHLRELQSGENTDVYPSQNLEIGVCRAPIKAETITVKQLSRTYG